MYKRKLLHVKRKKDIIGSWTRNVYLEIAGSDRKGIKMKIQNITNVEKFFEVVDSCTGKVELLTGEGDRLNLKSKLCQYVSMAKIFSDGTISELEIVASEPEDVKKLVAFMMEN